MSVIVEHFNQNHSMSTNFSKDHQYENLSEVLFTWGHMGMQTDHKTCQNW